MYTLLVEKVQDSNTVRGVVLDTDEETGLKSVAEIFEVDASDAAFAAGFLDSMCTAFQPYLLDDSMMRGVDVGRATTRRGILKKVIEQIRNQVLPAQPIANDTDYLNLNVIADLGDRYLKGSLLVQEYRSQLMTAIGSLNANGLATLAEQLHFVHEEDDLPCLED